MEKTEKRVYEAPYLTVVDIKAERGYATSLNLASLAFWQWSALDGGVAGQHHMEDYEIGHSWNQGSNAFWD